MDRTFVRYQEQQARILYLRDASDAQIMMLNRTFNFTLIMTMITTSTIKNNDNFYCFTSGSFGKGRTIYEDKKEWDRGWQLITNFTKNESDNYRNVWVLRMRNYQKPFPWIDIFYPTKMTIPKIWPVIEACGCDIFNVIVHAIACTTLVFAEIQIEFHSKSWTRWFPEYSWTSLLQLIASKPDITEIRVWPEEINGLHTSRLIS